MRTSTRIWFCAASCSKIASAVICLAFSSAAYADFGCPADLTRGIIIDGAGPVVQMAGRHVKVCSFTGQAGDISPDVCRVWVSQSITSKAAGKPLSFGFHEYQSNGATSCGALQDWALTPPYYLIPDGSAG